MIICRNIQEIQLFKLIQIKLKVKLLLFKRFSRCLTLIAQIILRLYDKKNVYSAKNVRSIVKGIRWSMNVCVFTKLKLNIFSNFLAPAEHSFSKNWWAVQII